MKTCCGPARIMMQSRCESTGLNYKLLRENGLTAEEVSWL